MMGFTQLLKYPSQKMTLKTISEGFRDGKKEPWMRSKEIWLEEGEGYGSTG